MSRGVMIDIETLDTNPHTALVLSVGAVDTLGNEFYMVSDPDAACTTGTKSRSTLEWWSSLPIPFPHLDPASPDPVPEYDMITGLRDFLLSPTLPVELWANPPQFDIVILRSLFRRRGVEWPVPHYSERCFRTYKAMFKPRRIRPVVPHNALCDAIAQAQMLRSPTL